ncbi:MAG TPA: reverse gyrase [Aquifex aeolicus]|nr:reverse gyrase [Aquifex aeolicus]
MIKAFFEGLCPNCGGTVSSDRLLRGLPCERCLPEDKGRNPCSYMREGNLKRLCDIEREVDRWQELFRERVGSEPWSLQRLWAKKVLLERSFALLAPTGVGKTTFGLITALYLAQKGKKSYVILPTKLLVQQVAERLTGLGLSEDEVLVAPGTTEKRKREVKERLEGGDFKVLVSTSMYLYKNHSTIPRNFRFIFIDDVDSFLKTATNVDKVLYMLGFSERDVENTFELIKLKEARNKPDEVWEKIKELSSLLSSCQKKVRGSLVVSSATGNPRSSRVKLFRELLGFEVGKPTLFLRNVVDVYEEVKDPLKILPSKVKELGKGGLVFVSSDGGKEAVETALKVLKREGIKAKSYDEIKDLSEFEEGELDVLVGIASYRNPLVRGLDLPHVVRYALFCGVPKITLSLSIETGVSHLLWALLSVRSLIAKHLKSRLGELDRWIRSLRRYSFLSEESIKTLREEIKAFLLSDEVRELIGESQEITLREGEEGYTVVVADVTGYLQASGRTSRMYAGGITKGLSYVLVEDRRAFNNLLKKVRWFNEDIKFIRAEDVDLRSVLWEIDADREKVKKVLGGKRELIKPVLVVVESPNKARTIANFFGKPVARRFGEFEVLEIATGNYYVMITSSLGHILDLSKEEGFHGVFVEGEKFVPIYRVIEDKERALEGLRLIAQEIDSALIATDPDTEGEKIGWDLSALLKPFVRDIKRIEFHEITRKAVRRAMEEPTDLREDLVKAQVIRRIADRWVGFEVSRILQSTFGRAWLSGGRVQIPVLGWVIDREKAYRKKKPVVQITFKGDRWFRIEFEFERKREAEEFFKKLKKLDVELISEEERELLPPPPFTTDMLLKEASERLRFGAGRTMKLAQDLFERGFITYHRTDSTRVSDAGMGIAGEFINEELGKEFFKPRKWGEGGAHECIRPTKALSSEELYSIVLSGQVRDITKDHISLYDLIFRRFVASQMKAVKVKVERVRIRAMDIVKELELRTEVLEEGFNLILPVELSPPLRGSVSVEGKKTLREVPTAYLFTQGTLVEEMKRRGIGRPSTYASTIEKLLGRGYIVERNGFLFPTKLGKEVWEFLRKQEKITPFVSEEFTKRLEELMDRVEEGREDYEEVLRKLYEDIIGFEVSIGRRKV